MSSHHIVKENQEPALLILNTEAIRFEKIQELLEWSPTVIITESCLEKVLSWGIKIDVALASTERIKSLTQTLQHQAPIQFVSFKDESEIITNAIEFLKSNHQKAVNVLANSWEDFEKLQITNLDCELFFEGKRWSFARDLRFRKWYERNVQLYTYSNSTQFTSISGVSKSLCTENNGFVQLESITPFWIGETV
jgi:thiamine pyrophosphokinase